MRANNNDVIEWMQMKILWIKSEVSEYTYFLILKKWLLFNSLLTKVQDDTDFNSRTFPIK